MGTTGTSALLAHNRIPVMKNRVLKADWNCRDEYHGKRAREENLGGRIR